MLKLRNFFYLFFLMTTVIIGQNSENYEFIGSVLLEDDTMISYKLSFKDIGNGKITGQSITDFAGEHRTISSIEGQIDYKNNTISYKETKNLLTKSNYEDDSFCYIHLNKANIKLRNRKSVIEGSFQGKYPNDEPCVSGEIRLVGTDFFFKKMDRFNRRISRINKIDSLTKAKLATSIFKNKVENNTLQNEDVVALFLPKAKHVFLEIWDEELEDGDKIDVFVNKKLVLENYEIKNQKKILKLPFTQPEMTIAVVANNIGVKAPNTVSLVLRAKQEQHKLRTKLEKNQQAFLLLKHN